MKIYTKSGDQGNTWLGKNQVPKSHLRVQCFGDLDELNAWLGMVASHAELSNYRTSLNSIQEHIFEIGGAVFMDAIEKESEVADTLQVEELEWQIDAWTSNLPPLKNFILPGGHPVLASIHVSRTVCRRAERSLVALSQEKEIHPDLLIYLNRLSDYLFTLARQVAYEFKLPELLWKS